MTIGNPLSGESQAERTHAGVRGRMVLGPRLSGAARPTFLAQFADRRLLVELDSSAMFKLVPANKLEHSDEILENERPRIVAAAQRLADQGFFADENASLVVMTALDL